MHAFGYSNIARFIQCGVVDRNGHLTDFAEGSEYKSLYAPCGNLQRIVILAAPLAYS